MCDLLLIVIEILAMSHRFGPRIHKAPCTQWATTFHCRPSPLYLKHLVHNSGQWAIGQVTIACHAKQSTYWKLPAIVLISMACCGHLRNDGLRLRTIYIGKWILGPCRESWNPSHFHKQNFEWAVNLSAFMSNVCFVSFLMTPIKMRHANFDNPFNRPLVSNCHLVNGPLCTTVYWYLH